MADKKSNQFSSNYRSQLLRDFKNSKSDPNIYRTLTRPQNMSLQPDTPTTPSMGAAPTRAISSTGNPNNVINDFMHGIGQGYRMDYGDTTPTSSSWGTIPRAIGMTTGNIARGAKEAVQGAYNFGRGLGGGLSNPDYKADDSIANNAGNIVAKGIRGISNIGTSIGTKLGELAKGSYNEPRQAVAAETDQTLAEPVYPTKKAIDIDKITKRTENLNRQHARLEDAVTKQSDASGDYGNRVSQLTNAAQRMVKQHNIKGAVEKIKSQEPAAITTNRIINNTQVSKNSDYGDHLYQLRKSANELRNNRSNPTRNGMTTLIKANTKERPLTADEIQVRKELLQKQRMQHEFDVENARAATEERMAKNTAMQNQAARAKQAAARSQYADDRASAQKSINKFGAERYDNLIGSLNKKPQPSMRVTNDDVRPAAPKSEPVNTTKPTQLSKMPKIEPKAKLVAANNSPQYKQSDVQLGRDTVSGSAQGQMPNGRAERNLTGFGAMIQQRSEPLTDSQVKKSAGAYDQDAWKKDLPDFMRDRLEPQQPSNPKEAVAKKINETVSKVQPKQAVSTSQSTTATTSTGASTNGGEQQTTSSFLDYFKDTDGTGSPFSKFIGSTAGHVTVAGLVGAGMLGAYYLYKKHKKNGSVTNKDVQNATKLEAMQNQMKQQLQNT